MKKKIEELLDSEVL